MQYDRIFVGTYQIDQPLGRSAYSALCTGKNLNTDQPVMMRFWSTAHTVTAEEQECIQAEVAALQQVQHPHLLPILEVCTSDEEVFLVSEYASSGSLNDWLCEHFLKPLLFEEALSIIGQIGQALDVLHQQGITHGNLTPYAVMLTKSKNVLLGDFRVKSILESIHDYQPDIEEGIPRCWYMAPEQFDGVYSAKSDQYALGCLAYLLFTGQMPFVGSTRAMLLQKHQYNQPKPLVELNPAIPAHIEAAVLKALAKQPEERYVNVQAFLEVLNVEHRAAIADQKTLAQSFETTFADQDILKQLAPDPVFESPISAVPEGEALSPWWEPVTAANWTRTRVVDASPVAPVKKARQLTGRSSRMQGTLVLISMVLLVLVIVFAASGWIFFSGKQTKQAASTSMPTALASTRVAATTSSGQSPIPSSPTSIPTPAPTSSLFATPSPTTGGLAAITPLLDCVMVAGNNFVAQFGFVNNNSFAVTIPLGNNNFISPPRLDGSQPTSFTPGYQQKVFQVTLFKRQPVTWSLNGSVATANSNSPRC